MIRRSSLKEKQPAPKALSGLATFNPPLETKLTTGVRYPSRAQQQLLPVLAQVDSGALCGIRSGPFQPLPNDLTIVANTDVVGIVTRMHQADDRAWCLCQIGDC